VKSSDILSSLFIEEQYLYSQFDKNCKICSEWCSQELLSSGQFPSQTILKSEELWAIVTISKKSVGNKL
jgi:hypothetical protein